MAIIYDFDEDNAAMDIARALGDIARAKGMAQVAPH